jgi:sugar lactone lactonase YvrE
MSRPRRRLLWAAAGLVAAAAAWLAFAPVPIEPVAWAAPTDAGHTGAHARNTRLANLSLLPLGEGRGPEHLVARGGWLYAGLADGSVVRVRTDAPAGTAPQPVLHTGGRPLGLDFDAQGRLLIADGVKGLLVATLPEGAPAQLAPLVTTVDDPTPGDPVRYADGVLAAPDGTIYFTDASRRFAPADYRDAPHGATFHASVLDTLEHSCTGRLLAHDPRSRYTRVVLRGLCFPNGLALSGDGRHLLVAETGLYRILKVSTNLQGLSAEQALQLPGQPVQVLIDKLPGFPDNLSRGEGGRIWVGLTKPRSAVVDWAAGRPWVREVTMRLPQALWPVPPAYGHVIAFDESGRIVADLQDPSGAYPETTAVTEAAGRLYIQSLSADAIGWLDARAAGLR